VFFKKIFIVLENLKKIISILKNKKCENLPEFKGIKLIKKSLSKTINQYKKN